MVQKTLDFFVVLIELQIEFWTQIFTAQKMKFYFDSRNIILFYDIENTLYVIFKLTKMFDFYLDVFSHIFMDTATLYSYQGLKTYKLMILTGNRVRSHERT